jgi:hypothetical protein
VKLQHIVERRRSYVRPIRLHHALRFVPVDALDGVEAGHHVGAGFDQPEHLVGRKPDIGIHEQEMGGGGVVEEHRHQVGPRARDQGIAIAQHDLEIDVGFRTQHPLQLEDRTGIDAGNLSAEAGRGYHQVNLIGHERLRSGQCKPQSSPKQ